MKTEDKAAEVYIRNSFGYTGHNRFDDCDLTWDTVISIMDQYTSQVSASKDREIEDLREMLHRHQNANTIQSKTIEELKELLRKAQTTMIVNYREEALKAGHNYDEASQWAKGHHRIRAIDKALNS